MALRDALVAFAGGMAVLLLCSAVARAVTMDPAGNQALLKGLMAVVSLVLIAVSKRSRPGSYGLERAVGVRWAPVFLGGIGLGALSSLLILLSGGRGLQSVFGSIPLWLFVPIIWFGSSIAEELLTRGWVQGWLERWRDVRVGRFSLPVATSGLLFGAMHITLFFRGTDPTSATVIVAAATLLGLWAGVLRQRHRGIAPAIAVHVCFNIGGMIGGILYAIGYRLTTGRLPFTS